MAYVEMTADMKADILAQKNNPSELITRPLTDEERVQYGVAEMRTCKKCGETKPLETGFSRHANAKDGYGKVCSECRSKQAVAAKQASNAKRKTPKEGGPCADEVATLRAENAALKQRITELTTTCPPKAKDITGKPRLSLVPMQIIYDIAEVREYGNLKYGDPENWRTVPVQEYVEAAGRHMLRILNNPTGIDPESGIPHYKHVECNMAFISAMLEEGLEGGNG